MNALLAAALLACLEGEARCIISDQGPVSRVYICGLPIDEFGKPVHFGFNGFGGGYLIAISPECKDA